MVRMKLEVKLKPKTLGKQVGVLSKPWAKSALLPGVGKSEAVEGMFLSPLVSKTQW